MAEILFVCTSDIDRGPMASIILSDIFRKNRIPSKVSSRGINAIIPERARKEAVQAVRLECELNLSDHISRQLLFADMEKADAIVTFTNAHKKYLLLSYPQFDMKIFTVAEFVGREKPEIKSLSGRDLFAFRSCAKTLKTLFVEML